MYFYDSNKGSFSSSFTSNVQKNDAIIHTVVAGCAFREPNDPGNLQFDWLEVQLKDYRNRGMQV